MKSTKTNYGLLYGERLNEELKIILKIVKMFCPLESMNLQKPKKDELTLKEGDIQVDERIIAAAFREAEKIKEKNKNIKDYIVFALISVILLSSAGISAYMGYGRIILTIQIFIIIFVPILIPFFIMHRLSKEVDL